VGKAVGVEVVQTEVVQEPVVQVSRLVALTTQLSGAVVVVVVVVAMWVVPRVVQEVRGLQW